MSRLRRTVRFVLARAGRHADRVARLSHYLAVSTLRREEMNDSIRRTWNDFYAAHTSVDAGLLPWEQEVIERVAAPGARVLLVGCGSGRDLIALAERGCAVTGVEPAASALRLADRALRERRLSAVLLEGFFEDVPVSGAFDAVIFSFYCYAFIPESQRRIDALRKAAAVLAPGGHIVLSHASTAVRPRPLVISLARLAGTLCGADWRLEPGDLVWDTRTGPHAYSYAHAFDAGELEREAAAAGLTPVFNRATSENVVVALSVR